MLISHRHRFIYTKTFKTAGTSVEAYFEPFCMAPGEWSLSHERAEYESAHGVIGFRGSDPPPGLRWWNHMSAAGIRARCGHAVWDGYFKFCVVRNPFDRAVSAFYFARSKGRLLESDAPDAVQLECWLADGGLRMDREQYLIDGRFALDAVLRYEFLHADLEDLCRHLGLPWEPERLPRFKAGLRPAQARPESMLTPRSIASIEASCAWELENFGYAPTAAQAA
jgi:Sulfotransferase family